MKYRLDGDTLVVLSTDDFHIVKKAGDGITHLRLSQEAVEELKKLLFHVDVAAEVLLKGEGE